MKIKALIVMTMTAAALLLPSCGKQPDKTSDANVNEPVEFGANITVSDSYAFRENDGRLYLWDLKTNSYEIFCTQPDCKHQTAAENADTKCSAVAPKEGYFYNYAILDMHGRAERVSYLYRRYRRHEQKACVYRGTVALHHG